MQLVSYEAELVEPRRQRSNLTRIIDPESAGRRQ